MLRERTQYFTDSQDVLAWLRNDKDPQKKYVANRVNEILNRTRLSDWYHIPTLHNPADVGTRPISVAKLKESAWLKGPEFLAKEPLVLPKIREDVANNISPNLDADETHAFKPPLRCFFTSNFRLANEEITTGKTWSARVKEIKERDNLPNLATADRHLVLEMQREALPEGLESIRKLTPKVNKLLWTSHEPFCDKDEHGLIRGGKPPICHSDENTLSSSPTLSWVMP